MTYFRHIYELTFDLLELTCVDEKLVWDSRMIHVVNCTGKDGSKDLKVCEHSLRD